eukprot:jgi/Bigna1/89661/estExt_fgenesh1_pg.C_530052
MMRPWTAIAIFGMQIASLRQSETEASYRLVLKNNISIPRPAFLSLPCVDYGKMAQGPCPKPLEDILLATSFGPTGKPGIYMMKNLSSSNPVPHLIPGTDKDLVWPNGLTPVPSSAKMILGDGFLVPGKSTGGIYTVDLADEEATSAVKRISPSESGWFYHVGYPYDVDRDGDLDIVAARAKSPPVLPWKEKEGELVWLENPGSENDGGDWALKPLVQGQGAPDFLFDARILPGSSGNYSRLQIAAPEYYGERLVLYTEKKRQPQDPLEFDVRVVDANLGHGFACSWVDLNRDGNLELLATNHKIRGGAVYAYEWAHGVNPSEADPIARHVLADGFHATKPLPGFASPGKASEVLPHGNSSTLPHIIVSADNENDVFHLIPVLDAAGKFEFQYTKEKLPEAVGSDIGQIAVGDTDGDGFADVYVPLYDSDIVLHYEFELN